VDTLIVAGGFGVYPACENEKVTGWVKMRSKAARRIASVCSGAFLLAAAGLLDGRRAVTHWRRCAEFARRFPAVRLEPDPIFIRDGNIWTSAGVTAGIDLSLALVEEDLGRAIALGVARQLVVFLKRPGGQAQFSTTLALQHGDAPSSVSMPGSRTILRRSIYCSLADAAGMSERSFVRHHRQATGRTPARAVEQVRVEAARHMPERGRPCSVSPHTADRLRRRCAAASCACSARRRKPIASAGGAGRMSRLMARPARSGAACGGLRRAAPGCWRLPAWPLSMAAASPRRTTSSSTASAPSQLDERNYRDLGLMATDTLPTAAADHGRQPVLRRGRLRHDRARARRAA
jgi:transcriptional regulator GlxA family with amidase domain